MERHLVSIVGPAINRSLVDAEVQEAVHVSKKRKGDYSGEQVRLVDVPNHPSLCSFFCSFFYTVPIQLGDVGLRAV